MFDREPGSQGGSTAGQEGRPPSHREIREGSLGESGPMEGIALNRTERALEETRDKLAEGAAPVIAEKMQEAITESTERLSGTLSEQAHKTAQALKEDARDMIDQKVGDLRGRVEQQANETMNRTADRIDDAARTVHRTADRIGTSGVRGTASRWAHQAADAGEDAAEYLRNTDVEELRVSLERQVREKPLQTLAIAAVSGWLVGKILR